MKDASFIIMPLLILTQVVFSQQWDSVGSGVGTGVNFPSINSFQEYQGKLYIGGSFLSASGIPARKVATWNGEQWDSAGPGVTSSGGSVNCMAVYNGKLYAGGSFKTMGNIPWASGIARWDGNKWEKFGGGGTGGGGGDNVKSLAVYKNKLYAGGNFWRVGVSSVNDTSGISAKYIACWNDTVWDSVGTGMGGALGGVTSMAVYQDQLYVGGDFYYAGGILAKSLAKWDGAKWDSVGSNGTSGYPRLMVDSLNDVLYAGNVTKVGGMSINNGIARWDGSNWDSVGDNKGDGLQDMIMYNGLLFRGSSKLLCLSNNSWCNIGNFNSAIYSLYVFKDELYIGGNFKTVNGDTVNSIVRYRGLEKNTIDSIPDLCLNANPVNLTGGSPPGGVYEVSGTTSAVFNPQQAGVGTHEISYTYTGDIYGCTNVPAVTNITVNAQPVVSLDLIDSVCVNSESVTLTGGNPPGGIYSGTGVSGNVFDPATADTGINTITYSFTDSNSCTSEVTSEIYVDVCTGINPHKTQNTTFNIIPNPNIGLFTLTCPVPSKLEVYNGQGSLMYNQTNKKMVSELKLPELKNGIYLFRLVYGDEIMVKRVVIEK